MILVVLTHVANFDFGVNVIQDGNFHFYLKQFRMPLFFFVSGFLFYKNNFVWNLTNIKTFLSKKNRSTNHHPSYIPRMLCTL